ncbi:hypothetical protein K469DRAFT_696300 [Zopfia rhizophila CBS 207.26]|uniref:FAD linked oxidase N-terminal domain-containing protein n=1 Tax=Zopfia rhizophila CBS 207.26 TaxID=1314779 RepID=A0A6A6DFJ0_9PEZI|nr:hypothetical protein K469DRAFT_696300 [Zopfia rhizophila CBS 207.26]
MDAHCYVVREIPKLVETFYDENILRRKHFTTKTFYDEKRPFRVYHGSTNSTRAMHDPRAVVNTSNLRDVWDINTESKFAMVEPNVSMDKLVKETLKYGLIPPVVPAFPGTTVGRTFAGTAAGSSSFKYGIFDQADPENDFVGGLVYGSEAATFGVIAVSRKAASITYQECRFSGPRDPWFYLHVHAAGSVTESVPMTEYLLRYDRGLSAWDVSVSSMHWPEHFIIQELVVPLESVFKVLYFLEDNLKIYPLRLCPIR